MSDDQPEDVKIETWIGLSLTRSLPTLQDSFKVLAESTWLVALVVDVFSMDAFDVAKKFNVSSYIFYTTNATVLLLSFYIPELDQKFSCEYRDFLELLKLPGCVLIHGSDFLDPMQDRKKAAYERIKFDTK